MSEIGWFQTSSSTSANSSIVGRNTGAIDGDAGPNPGGLLARAEPGHKLGHSSASSSHSAANRLQLAARRRRRALDLWFTGSHRGRFGLAASAVAFENAAVGHTNDARHLLREL